MKGETQIKDSIQHKIQNDMQVIESDYLKLYE